MLDKKIQPKKNNPTPFQAGYFLVPGDWLIVLHPEPSSKGTMTTEKQMDRGNVGMQGQRNEYLVINATLINSLNSDIWHFRVTKHP